MQLGRSIAVVGTSGAGKTFVAKALAAKLGLRYVSNDAIIWRANWVQTPEDESAAEMARQTAEPGWVIDSNLSWSNARGRVVLERADTIVWLDLSRVVVHGSILWRTVRRLVTRERLWHGNRESLRMALSPDSIMLWSVTSYADRKRAYTAMLTDPRLANTQFVRLHSRREVNAWLDSCGDTRG